MARVGLIALGLILMLLVAPFFFFGGLSAGVFFGDIDTATTSIVIAWISGVAGFILFIVGLIAKSKFDKTILARPPMMVQQATRLCLNCSTQNPLEAQFCLSCGTKLPTAR